MIFDEKAATVPELFATYRAVLRELKVREIVRTDNAPAGDYAEYLVAKALDGELETNSTESRDLVTPDDLRIQVKCRVADETGSNPRTKIAFSDFKFDAAAIVILRADYTIHRAVLVPSAVIRAHAKRSKRGFHVHARPLVLDAEGNTEITALLRKVADET